MGMEFATREGRCCFAVWLVELPDSEVVSHDEWVAAATGLAGQGPESFFCHLIALMPTASGQGPFVKTLIEPRAEFVRLACSMSDASKCSEA